MRIGVHRTPMLLSDAFICVTCISMWCTEVSTGRQGKMHFCFASGQNMFKSFRFCSPKPAGIAAVQQGAPSRDFPYLRRSRWRLAPRWGHRAKPELLPASAHRPRELVLPAPRLQPPTPTAAASPITGSLASGRWAPLPPASPSRKFLGRRGGRGLLSPTELQLPWGSR